jgi:Reverse transcriptase (RNA-dependent DNA polymerase)
LSDYRPISLLNCDYKLFTKILANRICEKLDTIIGDGQAACVKNRACVRNVTRLRNFIIKSTSGSIRARNSFKSGLFSLDLSKAFDQVNHAFLWKCLEQYGFPNQFIAIVKNLYMNATSQVLVNGFLSKEISIKKSVRQGCPLSMVLFVLYIEPLLKAIDNEIEGVELGATNFKSLAYADDVCYIFRGDEEADRVFNVIQEFYDESGATLSYSNSKFLRINGCHLGPQKITEDVSLKILGIKFMANTNQMIKANFEALIMTVKFMVQQNSIRNLNLIQKTWFANTFVLSKLWYVSQVIPPETNTRRNRKWRLETFFGLAVSIVLTDLNSGSLGNEEDLNSHRWMTK